MIVTHEAAYPEFSIGEALAAYDAIRQSQREEEWEQPRARDALDDYAATLTAAAHPPSECADPYSCALHGEQYRAALDGGQP